MSRRDKSPESLQHVKVEIDESSSVLEDQPLIQMDDPVSSEDTEPLGQLPVESNRNPSQTKF